MGLFLAAFAAQLLSPTELTRERSLQAIVPTIEFVQMDVREALRTLFRQNGFGGTIAPEVQGTITISLRNVPFETALQNVTRQVDATYRIDHGFFEVVRRPDSMTPPAQVAPEPSPIINEIEASYRTMADAVMQGKRDGFVSLLAPSFELVNATESKPLERAVRSMIDLSRAYPRFEVVRTIWGKGDLQFIVSYARPNAPTMYFRDFWRKAADGHWRMAVREETVLQTERKFVNTPLSKILSSLSDEIGVSITLAPSLDRRVTVNLTGLTVEDALQKLVRPYGYTYRIEGGVYQIVER